MSHFAEARILVVDDEPHVLEGYQHVLQEIVPSPVDEVAKLASELFEEATPLPFEKTTVSAVDLCRQGDDAVRYLQAKQGEGSHYPIAFIDMRMPPGIDGLETAKRLRQLSPDLNIVVVTGYSDRPAQQIALELGSSDRFFYLVKPINPDEFLQLTVTLINRWKLERDAATKLGTASAELESLKVTLLEGEARVRQLEETIEQLRHRNLARANLTGIDPQQDAADPPIHHRAPVPSDYLSAKAMKAAFDEGRAVANDPNGLALCPYSALTQSELFSAWIDGYRSRRDR